MAYIDNIKEPSKELIQKFEDLKEFIKGYEKVAVAYSSGVDSTFLLYAAKQALGDDVYAITASSYSFPRREYKETLDFCDKYEIKQLVVYTDELELDGFKENPKDRCYICKKGLFNKMLEASKKESVNAVMEGSNLDDEGDYRPGLRAIQELGIISPLRKIGFTKEEIRSLSKHFGLPTSSKPSFACLSSRIPYGEEITKEKLSMVEKSEDYLLSLGFEQLRVRTHGNVARIELLPEDFPKFMDENVRLSVDKELKKYGFLYVSLDILGFRSGSMNETLSVEDKKM